MWDLLLSEDESMIADSVRDYLSEQLPIERLRPNSAHIDMDAARANMAELGWIGIGLPEEIGGSGLTLVEEMLIQRECGRQLVSPSVMATILGAHVAFHSGEMELASDMIAGKASAALAIAAGPGNSASSAPCYAFDWNGSDYLLFWNSAGMGLFDPAAFTNVTLDECFDDSVTMKSGRLDLSRPHKWVEASKQPLTLRAQVMLAAALVGLAEHACDLAVEYAKMREQFGKPIGTFQAVKHSCADMGVRVRLGWYQTSLACLKVEAGNADALLHAAAAKLVAAQAAHENGRAGIQIHGGIGFQSECDAHWFVKRARLYDQAGGAIQTLARSVLMEPSPLW